MYYPNLKTSDSELRALRFLSAKVKASIIPIFELTRSRKSKSYPNGSISKRFAQLKDSYGNYPFILDLCTQEELMNEETLDLFEQAGGYANWRQFLSKHAPLRMIPCMLYDEDGDKSNFQEQAVRLHGEFGKVCLRTSATDELAANLLIWLSEVVPQRDIVACGVLYHLEHGRLPYYEEICREYVQQVIGNRHPGVVIFPGSSFPRFVTQVPGAGDDSGFVEASEFALENWLYSAFPNLNIEPSDFASVHPIRYPATGGNWIPRIDVFDGAGFQYSRTRRDDGGYRDAATHIPLSALAKLPQCWGRQQIELAMSGTVAGGSPSYWISVRVNCWITARALEG